MKMWQIAILVGVLGVFECGFGLYLGRKMQKKDDEEMYDFIAKDNETLVEEVRKLKERVRVMDKALKKNGIEIVAADDYLKEEDKIEDKNEDKIEEVRKNYFRYSDRVEEPEEPEDPLGMEEDYDIVFAGSECVPLAEEEFGESPYDTVVLNYWKGNGVLTYDDGMLEHDGDLPVDYLGDVPKWREIMDKSNMDLCFRDHSRGIDVMVHSLDAECFFDA